VVVTCISVTELPGSAPVVMTERGDSLFIYLSQQYDVTQIAEALEAASNVRQMLILNSR
jgi:hypothetical protein